jgi:proline dehydrogenase
LELLKKQVTLKLSKSDFSKLVETFPQLNHQTDAVFNEMDKDKDGFVDWIDISSEFSIFNPSSRFLIIPGKENFIKQEDFDTADLVLKELTSLCEYAKEKRVRLMMDAEQTYFQAAIDDVSLSLCRQFNQPLNSNEPRMKYALIYNTYQLYLKDAYLRLVSDVERSKRFGYSFGVKIVRGAYMVAERQRAQELGIPSPINETIEDTHVLFNQAIDFLIDTIGKESGTSTVQPLRFVVASHNKSSIMHACEKMKRHGIDAADGTVAFAQLMGMQDGTTYGLASLGIKTYKYIPYGPVAVTIPYLHRRAQENSSILTGGVKEDKENLLKELRIRFFGK